VWRPSPNHDHPLADWWAGGDHVRLELSGQMWSVFVRRRGSGPPTTLLHGYPSSSFQWAKIEPVMAEHRSLLMVDFLGFGASDKPREHVYSLVEQTDLVAALWAHEGIRSTAVVAHGYAVSVGQELLARRADGTLPVQLTQMVLLNGGLYPELDRRAHAQSRLLDPAIGHTLSRRLDQQAFVADLEPTFARGYDGRKDSLEMWDAYSRDDGQLNSHLLIRYSTIATLTAIAGCTRTRPPRCR
jgi:pimeloyl-ACP methyl ester carboxylesterase